MKNILKLLTILVSFGLFASSAAVQLVLDDWTALNRVGVGTQTNGHWASFADAGNGELIFIAGGASAGVGADTTFTALDGVSGAPTGFDTRPTQVNYDGFGSQTFSAGTWVPGSDPSDGSEASGQIFRLGNSGNQNRWHMALINNTSSDMIIDSIGYSVRNQYTTTAPGHPNHLQFSYVDSNVDRFNSTLIKTSADGLANNGEYISDSEVDDSTYIVPLDVTTFSANETLQVTHNLASIIGSTVKLAPGARAAFELAWLGARDSDLSASQASPSYGGGTKQTQFDMMVINATVVPEPSTYALIAGFAAFLFVAIKRRK